MRRLTYELLFRFKELAAFINSVSRNFLALPFAVLFKPCASTKKGSTGEIIIFTVPTIALIRAIISIIGFHTFFIYNAPYCTRCLLNKHEPGEDLNHLCIFLCPPRIISGSGSRKFMQRSARAYYVLKNLEIRVETYKLIYDPYSDCFQKGKIFCQL